MSNVINVHETHSQEGHMKVTYDSSQVDTSRYTWSLAHTIVLAAAFSGNVVPERTHDVLVVFLFARRIDT